MSFFENIPFFGDSQSFPELDEVLPLIFMVEFIMFTPMVSGVQSSCPPIVQVYNHQNNQSSTREVVLNPPSVISISEGPIESSSPDTLDFPFTLRKGKMSCASHPISHLLSYNLISPTYYSFIFAMSSIFIPKNMHEPPSHPDWQATMEEMPTLIHNDTWSLIASTRKSVVGGRWVFTIKVGLDDSMDRLKVRLVAKDYTLVYVEDYFETFCCKNVFYTSFFVFYLLYQLDIENAFLNSDLNEEISIEQTHRFFSQGRVYIGK